MQGRVETMSPRLVPDSFEYRLARAKIRAATGSANDQVDLLPQPARRPHRGAPARGRLRPRPRPAPRARASPRPRRSSPPSARATARTPPSSRWRHSCRPTRGARRRPSRRTAPRSRPIPSTAASCTASRTVLIEAGRHAEALALLDETRPRDAGGCAGSTSCSRARTRPPATDLAQHRAQAEAYYRRGNLAAAVAQLELATKVRDADYYELSIAEARLRDLRSQLQIEREAEKALKLG